MRGEGLRHCVPLSQSVQVCDHREGVYVCVRGRGYVAVSPSVSQSRYVITGRVCEGGGAASLCPPQSVSQSVSPGRVCTCVRGRGYVTVSVSQVCGHREGVRMERGIVMFFPDVCYLQHVMVISVIVQSMCVSMCMYIWSCL